MDRNVGVPQLIITQITFSVINRKESSVENHSTWAEHVESLAKEYVGVTVRYDGKIYKIVKVDLNGVMHINKPSEHNETTAVFANELEAEKAMI